MEFVDTSRQSKGDTLRVGEIPVHDTIIQQSKLLATKMLTRRISFIIDDSHYEEVRELTQAAMPMEDWEDYDIYSTTMYSALSRAVSMAEVTLSVGGSAIISKKTVQEVVMSMKEFYRRCWMVKVPKYTVDAQVPGSLPPIYYCDVDSTPTWRGQRALKSIVSDDVTGAAMREADQGPLILHLPAHSAPSHVVEMLPRGFNDDLNNSLRMLISIKTARLVLPSGERFNALLTQEVMFPHRGVDCDFVSAFGSRDHTSSRCTGIVFPSHLSEKQPPIHTRFSWLMLPHIACADDVGATGYMMVSSANGVTKFMTCDIAIPGQIYYLPNKYFGSYVTPHLAVTASYFSSPMMKIVRYHWSEQKKEAILAATSLKETLDPSGHIFRCMFLPTSIFMTCVYELYMDIIVKLEGVGELSVFGELDTGGAVDTRPFHSLNDISSAVTIVDNMISHDYFPRDNPWPPKNVRAYREQGRGIWEGLHHGLTQVAQREI